MLPVIALVGRPNVGKSTLFNRLTCSRDALVADFPGLTRDRQYGIGRRGPCAYVVVDTGGLSAAEDELTALVARQVRQAIAEADHLVFLVDARAGCVAADLDIAAELRRTGKPLTLVANKIDGLNWELASTEWYALGLGDPVPIAAESGRGLEQLLATLCAALAARPAVAPPPEEDGIRLAVVGRPNVGKSTLINRLLGEERVVVSAQPGTTRDSLFIPFRVGERRYTLIDTAGVRRRARVTAAIEKFSVIKTLQAIAQAHAVLLVLDAHQGIAEQDAHLAGHILDSGRALVVALNKWDGLTAAQRAACSESYARRLGFLAFAPLYRISALHGTGVGLLLEAVDQVYAQSVRELPTPLLTRLLEEALQAHQPPLVGGRRIKLRYAHQGGRNPPLIVIHGSRTELLPEAYRRYLIHHFHERLALTGTPLRLELRSGANPFAGHRRPVTKRRG